MIILVTLVILLIILNNTLLFLPKIREDYKEYNYSSTKDIWYKKEDNQKLIIFLHGMYSSPKTFDEIGKLLNAKGWNVYIPSLPASSMTLEELKKIGPWTWNESLHVAQDKINTIITNYDQVILGGHSQGGSLALKLATKMPNIKGLVVIASPITLYGNHLPLWKNIAISFSGILTHIVPKGIPDIKPHTKERCQVEVQCDTEGLTYPLTVFTFNKGLQQLRKYLYMIKSPIFLAYERNDYLVNFDNLAKIKKMINSTIIKEEIFNISKIEEPYGLRHQLLNYSYTKEKLNNSIIDFVDSLD